MIEYLVIDVYIYRFRPVSHVHSPESLGGSVESPQVLLTCSSAPNKVIDHFPCQTGVLSSLIDNLIRRFHVFNEC